MTTHAASNSIVINLAAAKMNGLSQSETPEVSNTHYANAYTNHKSTNDDDDDHIKVICRFRPKNSKERAEEKRQNLISHKEIEVYGNGTSLEIPRREKRKPSLNFTLDSIIWSDVSQNETFHLLAQKTVMSVVEGYNCTIFAFGQTGSGKTYTMFGPETMTNVEELGIIPRSVNYLFKILNTDKNIMKYQIALSIVEVYKEILRDLLIPEKEKKNRKRLEILSAGKEIRVKNCTEKSCDSVNEILKYIVQAQSNRAKHTTDFIGHDSSRSHCVVMISLTQRMLDDSIKFSKLNFGDLAGSELAAKTGSSGSSLKEAGKIHQGLLALENVINALVEKKKHIPYNDSKLTRLLSTSIGGNSKTTLLVTCSPSIWNRAETVSTLRFAKRAKKIKNTAKINKRKTREQLEGRIAFLEKENKELKLKLNKKRFGTKVSTKNVDEIQTEQENAISSEEKEKLEQLLSDKDGEINTLKDLLHKKDDALTQIEEDLEIKNDIVSDFGKEKNQYNDNLKRLNKTIFAKNAQINALQQKLDAKVEFESKLNTHTENLQNIVNHSNSVNNLSSSMTAALTEITQQQTDFYSFLKTMAHSIEKLHEKHDSAEKKRDIEIRDLKGMIVGIESNIEQQKTDREDEDYYNPREREASISRSEFDVIPTTPTSTTPRHYQGQSSLGFDLSIASAAVVAEHQHTKSNLAELVTTMKQYLEKANKEIDEDEHANGSGHVRMPRGSMVINAEDAKKYGNKFSIGKEVDVLDVSYTWYDASIVDIDVFDKKAVYINYDTFEDDWNEWIPLKTAYRIAQHKTRTDVGDINPSMKNENGGIHCLIATRYGRSKGADELQQVFSVENAVMECRLRSKSVLIQGYLYKESPSKFRKTNWKRLWFVVRNNDNIYYYDHKNMKSKQFRGIIPLKDIDIVQIAKSKGFTNFSFEIITHKRKTRRFSTNSEVDLVDWITCLQCLIYSDCHQINVRNDTPHMDYRNSLTIRNSIGGGNYFTDDESVVDPGDDDYKNGDDDSALLETVD